MIRKNIVKIIGVIFICAAVYFAIVSVSNYLQQLDAQDWKATLANVTDVEEYQKSTGTRRHRGSRTVYDISYEYYIGDHRYTGEIIESSTYQAVGDSITIKYDPDSPEHSTDIMEPHADALIINLLFAFLFGAIGVKISGLLSLLPWFRKKDGSEKL